MQVISNYFSLLSVYTENINTTGMTINQCFYSIYAHLLRARPKLSRGPHVTYVNDWINITGLSLRPTTHNTSYGRVCLMHMGFNFAAELAC